LVEHGKPNLLEIGFQRVRAGTFLYLYRTPPNFTEDLTAGFQEKIKNRAILESWGP